MSNSDNVSGLDPQCINAPPRTWLMLGGKLGDNAQAELVAESLGWPYHRKNLVFLEKYQTGKPRFRPTLGHVDLARSSRLGAPWPDLIITIGRRPSMAALAVRKKSGGHSRIVVIGRPRLLSELALGVATPQYSVPQASNVMHLDFPLMRPDKSRIDKARDATIASLGRLPRPLTAVLVGGSTSPYVLDAGAATRLLSAARQACPDGTIYLSTSRRTSKEVVERLADDLQPRERLYVWRPDDPENPYLGLLAHADRIIVTCDSVSMMIEAARMGKPLAIFEVPARFTVIQKLRRAFARFLDPTKNRGAGIRHWLYARGLLSYPRDLGRMERALAARDKAVTLGQPFPPAHDGVPDESAAVAARIRALFDPC
jgi:hypothetical protein